MLELKIPPPVYALLLGFAMWFLDYQLPLLEWIPAPWNLLGFVLIAAAFFMDTSSLLLFFRRHTTINPLKPQNASGLVTTGPYRFTRNPMYLGLLMILSGFATWLGSLSPFFLLPVFYLVITYWQIIPEERILEKKFGQDYLDYKQKVRRWI